MFSLKIPIESGLDSKMFCKIVSRCANATSVSRRFSISSLN
ncbi:Uncharacterised protein [Vibrio cholerae]|nr:Uncharacterised protein [Vibrio cholerae]CSI84573.1 Uncharacterised protein [Vibrio cholerae]